MGRVTVVSVTLYFESNKVGICLTHQATIPRDGMIKTVGYSPKELASLMNQFLERSRAKIPHDVSSEE